MLYLTLFAFTTILFYIAQKAYERSVLSFYLLAFVAIFALSFVAGARDNSIGTDISVYGTKVYNAASSDYGFWLSYNAVSGVSELFYFVINRVCSWVCDSYGLSLFVQMFIQTLFVFLAMKRYMNKAPLWITMLLYQLYYYNLSLNLMRQGLAMAFVFWAFKYVEQRQLKRFIVCAVISYFFHKTGLIASIIMLAIYWATEQSEKRQRMLLVAAVGLSILGIYMFSLAIEYLSMAIPAFKHFLAYAEGTHFKAGISTMDLLLRFSFFVVAFWFYDNKAYNRTEVNVLLFLLIVDTASLILGKYAYFTSRFAYYFLIIELPYIVAILQSGRMSKGTTFIANSLLIMFFLYYCIRFNYVEGNNSTYPYKLEFTSDLLY